MFDGNSTQLLAAFVQILRRGAGGIAFEAGEAVRSIGRVKNVGRATFGVVAPAKRAALADLRERIRMYVELDGQRCDEGTPQSPKDPMHDAR